MKKLSLALIPLALIFTNCNEESQEALKRADSNFTKKLMQENKQELNDKDKIEKIQSFYEYRLRENFPQAKISFIEKTTLKDLEAFVFEFEVAGEKTREMIFVKDNIFFAEGARLEDLSSLRDEAQGLLSKHQSQNILQALKDDKNFIITLGSGKKETFVFSDPECPYCKKHLEKINETFLKEQTIHFIFFTIHDNFKIIAALYRDLKDKESDKEKLSVMKHYFFENPNTDNVSEQESKEAKRIFEKYKNLGVLYTPFEIEVK